MIPRLLLSLLPISLLTACSGETTDSKEVQTESIWSLIYVIADETQSTVYTELNISGPLGNNIKLSDKDKLEASSNGDVKQMEHLTGLLDVRYRAKFDGSSTDKTFKVALTRDDNETLVNTLTLPAPFNFLAPQSGQTYFKEDAFDLEWTAGTSGNEFEVTIHSTCTLKSGDEEVSITTYSNLTDDGKLSIDLDTIEAFKNSELNTRKACKLEFTAARIKQGQVDSKYAFSSESYAKQQRVLKDITVSLRD